MDDRRRSGGTNSSLRTKEQGTHLTLNEHDDDDDDDDDDDEKFNTKPVTFLTITTVKLRLGKIQVM